MARSVLDDPIADLQMPPDIQIKNAKLQVECASRYRSQQPGQCEQL